MAPPFQGLISLPDRAGLADASMSHQRNPSEVPQRQGEADVQVLDALTAGGDVSYMLSRLELTGSDDRPGVADMWKLLRTMLQDASLRDAYDRQRLPAPPPQRRWLMSHAALAQGLLCRHPRLRRMVLALAWLEDAAPLPHSALPGRRGVAAASATVAESYQKMFTQLRGGSVLGALKTARDGRDGAAACMLVSAVMSAPSEPWMRDAQRVPLFGEYRCELGDITGEAHASRNEHRLSFLANMADELRELRAQGGDADAAASVAASGGAAVSLFERGIMGTLCGDYNAMVAACRALREGVLTWQDDLWCRLREALVAGLTLAIHGGGFRAAGELWTDAPHSAFLHAVKSRCLPATASDPQRPDGGWESEMETHLAGSICQFLRMQKLEPGTADAVQVKLLHLFLEPQDYKFDIKEILTAAVSSDSAAPPEKALAPRNVCALHVALYHAHQSSLLPNAASPQGASFNGAMVSFVAEFFRRPPLATSVENLATLISWLRGGKERSEFYARVLIALRRQACSEQTEIEALRAFQATEDIDKHHRHPVPDATKVVDDALSVTATDFGSQLVLRTPHRKSDELWLLSLTSGTERRRGVRGQAAQAMDDLWREGVAAAEVGDGGHHARIGSRVNRNISAVAAVVQIWQERIALWDGDNAGQARAATFWAAVCDAHNATDAVMTSSTALASGGALPTHEAALRLSIEEAIDRVADAAGRVVTTVDATKYTRLQAAAYVLELLGRCLLAAKLGADPAARLKQLLGLNAALARTGAFGGLESPPLSAVDAGHLNATLSAVRAGFAIEQKNRIREERRQAFHRLV